MIEIIFLSALAILWISFASIHDIKKRTVPNWVSFSLLIFALGFRLFYSTYSENGFGFFYQGVIGLGIFSIIAAALYYGRMFSMGDAKLMVSLGVVLPFSENITTNFEIFSAFLLLFLISGAVYGLGWSIFLPLKNLKKFSKHFSEEMKSRKNLMYSFISASIILILLGFFEILFFYLGMLTFIFSYLFVYAKTVDNYLLVKEVSTKKLEEGDWIAADLKVGRDTIKANWQGLNTEEIKKIRKKFKKVKIKEGIPFVPVFFISFLLLIIIYFWNFSIIENLFGFLG